MSDSQYTINLLGTSITIRTSEDLQYIKQLESRVIQSIQEVKEELGLVDPLSIALMASLFLADENFKIKRQAPSSSLSAGVNSGAERALEHIKSLLDRTLL